MKNNEALMRWNGGILRGAKRRLATRLGISESYLGRILRGKQDPGEELRRRIKGELGIDPVAGPEIIGSARDAGPGYNAPGQTARLAEAEKRLDDLELMCKKISQELAFVENWLRDWKAGGVARRKVQLSKTKGT